VSAPQSQTADAADGSRSGDVIAAHADLLLAYFLRRVDHREDAADLVGETLLQAWRRVAALPDDADEARMWLYGIAAKVLANARRTVRRRAALADRLRTVLAAGGDADAAGDATSEAAGVRVDVDRALQALKPADRELVRLVHWDGVTLAEAAALLRMPASTARTRYARARATLADALGARADL